MRMEEYRDYLFASLNWKDLEILKGEERFVLLFPIGSTESHGPHCPIGTDTIIALEVSVASARRLRGMGCCAFVLPPLSYTVAECARGFPGTVSIPEETESALIAAACLNLVRHGMTKICIVNNHGEPGNVRAIYDAIRKVYDETGVRILFPNKLRKKNVERLTEAFRKGETHADRYETSLVLAIDPSLVNEGRRKALPYLPINLAEKIFKQNLDDFRAMGMDECYCGDPAAASEEEGKATLEVLVDITVEGIIDMFAGRIEDEGRGLYGRKAGR